AGQGKPADNNMSARASTYEHRVLMHAIAWAAAPKWTAADWSALLDSHEWIVLNMPEKKNKRSPNAGAVGRAVGQMSAKWVDAVREDTTTLAEAAKGCRTER
ncbi:unnamed protein product, partial [Prorocentrum cordatum]